MQSYLYRPGYNALQAAVMAFSAAVLGGMWLHKGSWLNFIVMIVIACGAVVCAAHALSNEPALTYDEEGVHVSTVFGLKHLGWSEISSIYLQARGSSSILSIALGGNICLCFQSGSGMIGANRTWLSTAAIQLPPGGAAELLDRLNRSLEASRNKAVNPETPEIQAASVPA